MASHRPLVRIPTTMAISSSRVFITHRLQCQTALQCRWGGPGKSDRQLRLEPQAERSAGSWTAFSWPVPSILSAGRAGPGCARRSRGRPEGWLLRSLGLLGAWCASFSPTTSGRRLWHVLGGAFAPLLLGLDRYESKSCFQLVAVGAKELKELSRCLRMLQNPPIGPHPRASATHP